jgi:hypothetical protein
MHALRAAISWRWAMAAVGALAAAYARIRACGEPLAAQPLHQRTFWREGCIAFASVGGEVRAAKRLRVGGPPSSPADRVVAK